LHRYVGNPENDTPDYLAVTNTIDRQIEEMDAVCRLVQAKHRSKKRAYLCFDEWNVWYKNMQMDGEGKFAPHLIEEVYNLEDALVVAGFLHSFIRHADVVKIANLAQIVNVIAPILTRENDLLVQSIFYPFMMFSKRKNGTSLRCSVDGPGYEGATNGRVPFIDASAILADDRLQVFLTNRSLDETAVVDLVLSGRSFSACESAEVLTGPDAKSANTFGKSDVVTAKPFEAIQMAANRVHCTLPHLSFVAITFIIK
jgi:alpha-L-arabinofuranosidase